MRRAEQKDDFVHNLPKYKRLWPSQWNPPPDSGDSHGKDSWVGQYFPNKTNFQQLELVYLKIEELMQTAELGK